MRYEHKAEKELINELLDIRQRIAGLATSQNHRKQLKDLLRQSLKALEESGIERCGEEKKTLDTVSVPDSFQVPFFKAQEYVRRYFQNRLENPEHATINISGERYILVRAASMSKEFFDLLTSLYQDRGEKEARNAASSFLFDIAHALGRADARSFNTKMGVTDPIEKLSAGPIHFAHSGWAFVEIFPESKPSPDENYYLTYDHPFSFEAEEWLKRNEKTEFPVCIMNAGYSSGWCEESFGIPLVAVEIECRAKGDDHCRFIMAPPSKIEQHVARYSAESHVEAKPSRIFTIPEFFQRKRLEDELRDSEDKFRSMAASAQDAIIMMDNDGNISYWNHAAERIFGYTKKEAVGNELHTFLGPERYHEAYKKGFSGFRETGEGPAVGKTVELSAVRKDGTEFPIELSVSAAKRKGKWNAIGILRDITKRKLAEEELQKYRDQLEALVEGRTAELKKANEQLQQEIAKRNRVEKELHYRAEFERLITTTSTNFINLAPDEIDNGINRTLQAIGEFAGVDRSYVFVFRDNGKKFDNTHEWCAEGIEPQIHRLKSLSVDEFAWVLEKIRKSAVLHLPRVADLPPEAHTEKEEFESEGIQSLICVPMTCRGRVVGFLGFDSVREEKTWSEDVIALLKVVGELFANALERKGTEQALRASEEKLRLIFENAVDAIFWADPETGLLTNCNKAAETLLEKRKDEIIGHHQTTVHPPEKTEYYSEMFRRHIEKHGCVDDEAEVIAKSGKIIPVHIAASVTLVEGRPIIQGIFSDITERKHMEEEIEDNAMTLALDLSEQFEVLQRMNKGDFSQPAPEDSKNELVAKLGGLINQILDKLRSANREIEQNALNLALDLSEQFEVLQRMNKGDFSQPAPEDSKNELVAKLGGLINQILDRFRKSGKELRCTIRELQETRDNLHTQINEVSRARAELRQIFQTAADGMRVIDKDFNVLRVNEMFIGMSGASMEESLHKKCYEILPGPFCGTPRCTLKRILAGEEGVECEVVRRRDDGTEIPCILMASPFKNPDGEIIGIVEDFKDITERKHMEEKIEDNAMTLALDLSEQFEVLQRMNKGDFSQPAPEDCKNELVAKLGGLINQILWRFQESNRKLDQSNKELQDFVYVASHDLRAPLRRISSFGRLLENSLEGKLDDDQRENLAFMIEGANRLHQIIDDLLTYSRVTTRAKPLEVVDLNEVIENLKKVELAARLEETSGTILVPKPLPVIQADPSQVHELLQNLIGNGLKYHHKGTLPKIEVRASPENGMIRVEVEDNGIGIDESYHQEIFTMFKRLHSAKDYEGTGIGLAICKKIVERHGGDIGIGSTPGQGSTFWFTLPNNMR